jgi:hypothetical protein
MPIKICHVYDSRIRGRRFMGYDVTPVEMARNYTGKIIIASFTDILDNVEILKELGVENDKIVDLW